MQKGSAIIWILVAGVLLALLFVPIPRPYYEPHDCVIALSNECSPFGPSIFERIKIKINESRIRNVKVEKLAITPTPADLSRDEVLRDWKTYTNTKYGYTIKYPPDWTRREEGWVTTYFLPPEAADDEKSYRSISVSVRHKDTPIPPVWIEYQTIGTVIVENKQVNVLQAKNLASEQYLVEIKRGDYFFKFIFGFGLDRKYDSVFDTILSTFKFLPASPTGGDQDQTEDEIKIRQLFEREVNTTKAEGSSEYPVILKLDIESDWATIDIGSRYKTTGQLVGRGAGFAIVHKEDGVWMMAFEGEDLFKQWLLIVPESVLSAEDREYFKYKYSLE